MTRPDLKLARYLDVGFVVAESSNKWRLQFSGKANSGGANINPDRE